MGGSFTPAKTGSINNPQPNSAYKAVTKTNALKHVQAAMEPQPKNAYKRVGTNESGNKNASPGQSPSLKQPMTKKAQQ